MSAKGQLVVPQSIRNSESIEPGERFFVFPVEGGVLFKKAMLPSVRVKFGSLAAQVEKHFKARGVKKSDVGGALKWARKG
ncbi:hypothetical protein HY993_00990 [Candidatus Micrarchaeota archaeon]|nr:hypothetical protein [Candidatus Micrarchaeota archaeon]